MSKKKFRVVLVLDESGSMLQMKESTINGVNEYVDTFAKGERAKDVRFTLVTFSSERTTVHYDNKKLKNVLPLTSEVYVPNGMTPLYDAIGSAINAVDGKRNDGDDVLVVIQTDGLENYSKEYTAAKIVDLIESKKKEGWTFAFLGANIDAFASASALGISRGNTIAYASATTFETFSKAAFAGSQHVSRGGGQTMSLYEDINDQPTSKEDQISITIQ